MSGIRAKDTDPEIKIRRALHARGFRFRLHAKNVPGKPDLVLARYRAAIFVHGCFWHGHDCPMFRMPGTRQAFWEVKLERNRQRDIEVQRQIGEAGWRSATVWECAIRGPSRLGIDETADLLGNWLHCLDSMTCEVRSPERQAS